MPYPDISPIPVDDTQLLLTDTFEIWKDKFNKALQAIYQSVEDINTALPRIPQPETVAERMHASASDEYGLATSELYGHAKASNVVPSAPNATGSVGSQTHVYALADHIHPKQTDLKGNADTASALYQAQYIDGVSFKGNTSIHHYATCSTASGTVAKTVTLAGFTRTTGAVVHIKFNNTNLAANATLNVTASGAANIRMNNMNVPAGVIQAGCVYTFVFDGTYWQLTGLSSTTINGNNILNNNFNSLTIAGDYFITTTATTANAPKPGIAASYWVKVNTYVNGTTTYIMQEARMHSTTASSASSGPANVLVRCYQGTTWGPWTYPYAQFAG